MNKEQKLKLFMAWCNTDLLQWNIRITAEYEKYETINQLKGIYIRNLDNTSYFTSYTLSEVINKAEELKLSCFVQYRNQIEIEIC